MTRLTSELLQSIGDDLDFYDGELLRKTGLSLRQLACRAAGVKEAEALESLAAIQVGIVPVTAGEGMIEGFCGAVAGIVSHLGATSFVTSSSDVAGLAEAIERGANVVFLADDNRFVALGLSFRTVVDNSEATARGYVAALEILAGGLKDRPVLVLGAGQVGKKALAALKALGARAAVFDPDPEKIRGLATETGIFVEKDLESALKKHSLLVDASPAAGVIRERHVKPDTFIAAPGLPLGLCPGALVAVGNRFIHDPLQIGVATMLILAVKKKGKKKKMSGG
jgi:pyrrolysine biosynthesis protein PylD